MPEFFRKGIFLVPVIVITLIGVTTLSYLQGSDVYLLNIQRSGSWFNFSHIPSNAFFSWNFPFYQPKGDTPPNGSKILTGYSVAYLLISGCLLTLLAKTHFHSVLVASVISSILFIIGFDPLVEASILSAILFYLGFYFGKSQQQIPIMIAPTFLFALLASLLAVQLAPLIAFLSFLVYRSNSVKLTDDNSDLAPTNIIMMLVFALAFYFSFTSLMPEFQSYSFVSQHLPLASPYGPVLATDREFIRLFWSRLACLLVPLFLLMFLDFQLLKTQRKLVLTGLLLLACLLIDTLVSEQYSQQGPIASVARILPGAYFIPLAPIFFVSIVLIILLFYAGSNQIKLLISASAYFMLIPLSASYLLSNSFLLPAVASQRQLPTACHNNKYIKASPSTLFYSEVELAGLCEYSELKRLALTKNNTELTTSLSDKPRRDVRLNDGDLKTRWSPKNKQAGNEWVQFELHDFATVSGLVLFQGEWRKDTPAAINIYLSSDCNSVKESTNKAIEYKEGLSVNNAGLPYYSSNNNFSALWSPREKVKCIRIEQTATKNDPWSIAEVELFIAEKKVS